MNLKRPLHSDANADIDESPLQLNFRAYQPKQHLALEMKFEIPALNSHPNETGREITND